MLPRKKFMGFLITILTCVGLSEEYSSGAPSAACEDQLPRHETIVPQASVPPYMIVTSSAQVRQGDVLNVTVGSPAGAPVPIGGFLLQAREIQNPDMIVGRFVKVPSNTHTTTCVSPNDTVTHSNPEEKPAMTFQWQAPADFLGGVEFRATVAQSYATFWKGVESPLVEIVTVDSIIDTPASTLAPVKTTPAPPVILASQPKTTPRPLDIVYQGCSDTKLCFGVPQNCVAKGDCVAIVSIFVSGDIYTFEIQGTGNPKYVAAALSMDNKMGDDSAMECVRNDNGRVSLFTSWTYPKTEPYVRRSDSPQDIVQLQESSIIDGKLYCKFTRNVVSIVQGITFDLASKQYNLMVVSGDSMKDPDRVGFHTKAYEATGEPLSLSVVGSAAGSSKTLVKLHGCLMIIAWLATASLGILLARYFRQTWVGRQLGGKDLWFAYHRILMGGTWLLTVIGFIVILAEVGGISTTGDNPHAITGLITVILCFIQPIGAFFRPHPGTKHRPVFNWAHWLFGNSAHILGIVTLFFAVYLQKAELPSWSVYILTAFVVFHVIVHVFLSISSCVSIDEDTGAARVSAFPMKELAQPHRNSSGQNSLDAPMSRFRRIMLYGYSPLIVILTIAMICLVALAPFEQTYNTILGA